MAAVRRSTSRVSLCSVAVGCVLAAAAVATTFDAPADDSVRCRSNRLVNVGMVVAEVIARCGEPKSRSVQDVPVRATTPTGNSVVTGSTRVERWTYERGQGQFDAMLTFEDDKLVRIDLLNVR